MLTLGAVVPAQPHSCDSQVFVSVEWLHHCSHGLVGTLQDEAGQSKGAGIVEFERPDEALQAISRLTNTVGIAVFMLSSACKHQGAYCLATGTQHNLQSCNLDPGLHLCLRLNIVICILCL